jgi:hypothetical protein
MIDPRVVVAQRRRGLAPLLASARSTLRAGLSVFESGLFSTAPEIGIKPPLSSPPFTTCLRFTWIGASKNGQEARIRAANFRTFTRPENPSVLTEHPGIPCKSTLGLAFAP